MIVGVPKEIKTAENRVALVPAGVESLVGGGHSALGGQGAGGGSGVAGEARCAGGGARPAKTPRGGGAGWRAGGVRGGGGGGGGARGKKGAAGGGPRLAFLVLPLQPVVPLAVAPPSTVVLFPPTRHNLLEQLRRADLVIGAVLLPG